MVVRKNNIDASGSFDKGLDNILEEDYIPDKCSSNKSSIVIMSIIAAVSMTLMLLWVVL